MSEWTRREMLWSMAALSAAPKRKPNIVMILCDDLGSGDIGCYGGALQTPNLDRMASEGMRFNQCTSANAVCSPSRAGLLTGRYPTRVMVERVLNPSDTTGLPDSETTLAMLLKKIGYKTACVGKWHLGHLPQYLPTHRGFDSYLGIPYSNDMSAKNSPFASRSYPLLPLMRDEKVIEEEPDQRYLTKRYTEEALGFIERSGNDPFFLYFPHTFPHIPLYASERFRGKSAFGIYGDVVAEIDWSVGEVMAALKKRNLDRDTLVMFSSDNGPWFQGSPGRLRGRKGMTNEGGFRVPFLARWPGRVQAGAVSEALISLMDVFPTVSGFCEAGAPPNPLDGIDIAPIFGGKQKSFDREALLYFDGWNLQCARWGRWKLHMSRWNTDFYNQVPAGGRQNLPLAQPELYDVAADIGESYDVAAEHPDVVKEIQGRVERLLPGFPEPVKKAWAETKARPNLETRTGAFGRPGR